MAWAQRRSQEETCGPAGVVAGSPDLGDRATTSPVLHNCLPAVATDCHAWTRRVSRHQMLSRHRNLFRATVVVSPNRGAKRSPLTKRASAHGVAATRFAPRGVARNRRLLADGARGCFATNQVKATNPAKRAAKKKWQCVSVFFLVVASPRLRGGCTSLNAATSRNRRPGTGSGGGSGSDFRCKAPSRSGRVVA